MDDGRKDKDDAEGKRHWVGSGAHIHFTSLRVRDVAQKTGHDPPTSIHHHSLLKSSQLHLI